MIEGPADGRGVGKADGNTVGVKVGDTVGSLVGCDGSGVGDVVGFAGPTDGLTVGLLVGFGDGSKDGFTKVGTGVGSGVGSGDGATPSTPKTRMVLEELIRLLSFVSFDIIGDWVAKSALIIPFPKKNITRPTVIRALKAKQTQPVLEFI